MKFMNFKVGFKLNNNRKSNRINKTYVDKVKIN